jgi:hypothetical protein
MFFLLNICLAQTQWTANYDITQCSEFSGFYSNECGYSCDEDATYGAIIRTWSLTNGDCGRGCMANVFVNDNQINSVMRWTNMKFTMELKGRGNCYWMLDSPGHYNYLGQLTHPLNLNINSASYLFSAEEEISPLHRPWLGLMLRRLPLLTASISESR